MDRPQSQEKKETMNQKSSNYFKKKKENLEDKARIAELEKDNLEVENDIALHSMEIDSLKEQVIKLLEERHLHAGSAPDYNQIFGGIQYSMGPMGLNSH